MEQEKRIIKASPFSRHIILYSLNEYKRSGFTMDDMGKILSAISNIPKEALTFMDIFQTILDTFIDLAHYEKDKDKVNFYTDIFGIYQDEQLSDDEMLEYIFDFMASVELEDRDDNIIIDLGEPDGTILPIQEYYYI